MELDAAKLGSLLQRPNGDQLVRAVVPHELGHLVGLAHVNSPSQLMYPQAQLGVTDFGAGDLTGLAALGKGVCLPCDGSARPSPSRSVSSPAQSASLTRLSHGSVG